MLIVSNVDISNLKDVAQIAALLIGGLWTYQLFIKGRSGLPRATLSHKLAHRALPGERTFLRVTTQIANTGTVVLNLDRMTVRVQQVIPLGGDFGETVAQGLDLVQEGETLVRWPVLGERSQRWDRGVRQVEPGETDEITCDFVLRDVVQTVQVYTYFNNVVKSGREIGWVARTLYDFTPRPEGSSVHTVDDLVAKERSP
jgi:hypothetical protein